MRTDPSFSGDNDEGASAHVVDEITDSVRMAEDALRRLAHLTIGRPSMIPADLDTVLAHLAAVPQVATQLGRIRDRSREAYRLSMGGMTATTDPDLAVDTAWLHLVAVRDSALETNRHLNSAGNEVAHINASPPGDASDARQIAEDMPAPCGAGSRRQEDREPPSSLRPSRDAPAR